MTDTTDQTRETEPDARKPDWEALADALRTSRHFDPAWYIDTFPDVAASEIEPALHFVKYGTAMGRDPGPDRALTSWRAANPQVAGQPVHDVLGRFLDEKIVFPEPAQTHLAKTKPRRKSRSARAIAAIGRPLAPYLPVRLFPKAIVPRVNTAARAGDRAGWARAMNIYLALRGGTALSVSDKPGNVLEHITFADVPAIETGPLVSVIMPVWNAEESVAYAVRSILSQSWRSLELIVVDDASTDATPQILQDLAATDPRMTVLRNVENAGPYVSKNIGLMAAKGEFVTGHDSDDLALPRRIEQQVAFLQENGHLCGFISMMRMTETGELTRLGVDLPNSVDGIAATAFISLMIRRDVMKGIFGHWDVARFGADSELDKRIMAVLGGNPLPRLHQVGQFMLEREGSLTNDPTLGYVEGKISPLRRAYRDQSRAWNKKLTARLAYLPFPHEPRRFKAPPDALNAPGVVERVVAGHKRSRSDLVDRVIDCDVCIVTNLRFPGGNCSSTLDELRFLTEAGLKVTLVHCVIDIRLEPVRGFEYAPRFEPWADYIVPWFDVQRLRCRHLIVRHPDVATAMTLRRALAGAEIDQAHIVINNGTHRESGERYFLPADVVEAARTIPARAVEIIPISPLIRQQIEAEIPPELLSPQDWSPTFDVADYALDPKADLAAPFVIGRHGRDAPEKWIETSAGLKAAYPGNKDFQINILGGADKAVQIMGRRPANWTVAEFGAIAPKDYLEQIDIFVYFPHTERYEAFGRTIVEAMIASRPVILPPRFETTFKELAFYGTPESVAPMVRALATDWAQTRVWLAAVQEKAIARYASQAIALRMPDLDIGEAGAGNSETLPPELLDFKRRIEAAGDS